MSHLEEDRGDRGGSPPPSRSWIRVDYLLRAKHHLTVIDLRHRVHPGGRCPSKQDTISKLTPLPHLQEASSGCEMFRGPEGPMAIGSSHTSFPVKRSPRSNVMSRSVLCQQIKLSGNPWVPMPAKTLWAEKALTSVNP